LYPTIEQPTPYSCIMTGEICSIGMKPFTLVM
jgi:hypothetical protein